MAFFLDEQERILERYFRNSEHFRESVDYLRGSFADFVTRRIAPAAAKNDAQENFDVQNFQALGQLGYLSLTFPATYGGMNLSPVYHMAGMETLSKGDAGFALGVGIHHTTCDGIARFASEAIKEEVLPGLISGKKIGAFALSESDSGSDAQALRTSYKVDRGSGDFILNGSKFWITNALSADLFFVMAHAADDTHKISAFLVAKDGGRTFEINPIKDKMGVRGSNTGELVFRDHRVSKKHLLGTEGDGFKYAMHMLNGGRNGIGAWATGVAQGSLEKYVVYARERKLFGKTLIDLDNTRREISEMLIMIKGARELAYAAAYDKGTDHPQFPMNAAIAKVAGTEAAFHVGERVIQLAGGFGYLRESNLERGLRDALLGRIGEGANELLKIMVIPRFFYHKLADSTQLSNW